MHNVDCFDFFQTFTKKVAELSYVYENFNHSCVYLVRTNDRGKNFGFFDFFQNLAKNLQTVSGVHEILATSAVFESAQII